MKRRQKLLPNLHHQMNKTQLIREIKGLRNDLPESTLVLMSDETLKNVLTVEIGRVELEAQEMANEVMA